MYLSEIEERGFRNETEREFLTALFAHSSEWAKLGVTNDCCMINLYFDSILMVAFDICDWNGKNVLRSLKVDFNGTSVLMGEAGTNLFDSKFDIHDPKIKVLNTPNSSPKDLADETAHWLFFEMSRPIILKEWITWFHHHKEYQMADNDKPLNWSASGNKKCWWFRSPTRAAIVHPITKRKTLLI